MSNSKKKKPKLVYLSKKQLRDVNDATHELKKHDAQWSANALIALGVGRLMSELKQSNPDWMKDPTVARELQDQAREYLVDDLPGMP